MGHPNAMEPEQLARALGIPLFHTPYFLPVYPDGEWGPWRLAHMGTSIDHGYYTRQWVIAGMPVLLRRNPDHPDLWETWMSLTPHEIESQEPGCLFARGHTVIMGLGLGWIALNVVLNPAVQRVTVVERDSDVINLFSATGVLRQIPSEIGAKMNIIQADALEWKPREPVEFLFADIWRQIAEPEALAEVQAMQRRVQAEAVYFWGQELRLYAAFQRIFGPETPFTLEGLELCVERELRIPLILPWKDEYVDRVAAVVKNRRNRGLPL